jgi:outer membrane murein-binding lipoprotein Lpp
VPIDQSKMQEETMKHLSALAKLTICGAVAAAGFVIAGTSASAQTATTSTTSSAPNIKQPRTTATPQMIDEAVQRSKARAAKARETGTPETFGSEEPFTYDPTKR